MESITISGWSRYRRQVADLPASQKAALARVADIIRASYRPGARPVRVVRVYGHADWDTPRSPQREQQISAARARMVADWLKAALGAAIAGRITWDVRGLGAARLAAPPTSPANRARNRRVAIGLVRVQQPAPQPQPPQPQPPQPQPGGSGKIQRVWLYCEGIPNLARIRDLQVTDVALMLNGAPRSQNQAFGINFPAERILAMARQLQEIGVSTHLVTWLLHTERFMTEAARRLRPLCEQFPFRSLQFDLEGTWHAGLTPAAARSVVDRYWGFSSWPCTLGVTDFPYAPLKLIEPVIERCQYVLPQAYSHYEKDKTTGQITIPNVLYPGVTQATSHRIWKAFSQKMGKQMVMGLGAFQLSRPHNETVFQAMQKSIVTTEELADPSVSEVAYWSLLNLKYSKETYDFIKQASMKARQGLSQKDVLPGGARESELPAQAEIGM